VTHHSAQTRTHQPSIVIIGAGFAGIIMALHLRCSGFTNLTILEKGDGVGGVWRDNTYPGAACDVPSPLYSISTEPNPHWPRRFSEQPDILRYLQKVATEHELHGRIRLRTELAAAEFDEPTNRWHLRTTAGDVIKTDVLIPAVGQLSHPSVPAIAGSETFQGTAFHSARWNHETDLRGKHVAVIGTGASAIQFVPAIQPHVTHLTVLQRSPAYILPKPDRHYRRWQHRLFRRVPATQRLERFVRASGHACLPGASYVRWHGVELHLQANARFSASPAHTAGTRNRLR